MQTLNNPAYGALVLRLALGIMFVAHGWLKVSVFTVAGTVAFFESVGFPGWLAYVTIVAEIGGGLLLIAGLYARWVALATIPLLLGALSVHFANGWLFSAPNGGWEYPAFLAAAALAQGFLGNGAYALSFEKSRGVYLANATA
ncbi:MAG: DoxX family protein [Rhodospirillaceae bacterium]